MKKNILLLLVSALTLHAQELPAPESTPAYSTVIQSEIDAATERGLLSAIMDVEALHSMPAGTRRNSLMIMADLASMNAAMMRFGGAVLGAAYFEARAQVFAASAAFYGEGRGA